MFLPQDIERFWSRVSKTDGCWIWTGAENNAHYDYGRIMIRGVRYSPHRLSWLLSHGAIPDGQYVCHSCDNPRCVRPDHLFLGTLTDNNRDRAAKGRSAPNRGEDNPFSKLSDADVAEIRRLYKPRKCSQRYLAERFGVSQGTIWQIVNGRYWSHITEPSPQK